MALLNQRDTGIFTRNLLDYLRWARILKGKQRVCK